MKKIQLAIFILLIPFSQFSQTLPEKIKFFCPDYILNPKGEKDWQDIVVNKVKKGDFGRKKSNTPWTVYSDRDNNSTYIAANSATKYSELQFLEKLYVADISNGFALVFSDEYKQTNDGEINSSAKTRGWVPIDNLILWNQCPKDQNQIYRKGVVVFSPSPGSDKMSRNPNYLLGPSSKASMSSISSQDLDILFSFKTIVSNNKRYYLLAKDYIFEQRGNQHERVFLGWLSEDYLTEWKYRLLVEPVYATRPVNYYLEKGIFPCIFPEDESGMRNAGTFKKSGKAINPLWVYDQFSSKDQQSGYKRMHPNRMRNPILTNAGDLFRVATLSTFEQTQRNPEEIAELKEMLEKNKQASNTINVIFVIDATKSMTNFYPAIVEALENVMKYNFTSNIKVGVVLYKDYKDPDRIKFKPVTDNISGIITFIKQNKENLGSIDSDDYEAMFLGLETALDLPKMKYQKDQSNFIIHIGDAGNQRIDPQGKKWQDLTHGIVADMSENRINYFGYQVNHFNKSAYDDFAIQIGTLQKELAASYKSKIKTEDLEFKLKTNRLYILSRKTQKYELPVYVSYKYATAGRSESLDGFKTMIVDNIKDFQAIVNSNINDLNSALNGSLTQEGGLVKERVKEVLRAMGKSESEVIDIISLIEGGGIIKFFGYTSNKIDLTSYNLFDFVLLFTDKELEELVQTFSIINSTTVNDSKKFQDALISVGQSMLGNFDPETAKIDEMLQQIYGLPVTLNNCGNFKIVDIPYMNPQDLEKYIDQFKQKFSNLIRIVNNASQDYTFKSNGNTYYWIKLTDMPGVCE